VVLGLTLWFLAATNLLVQKQERNQQWQQWLSLAEKQVGQRSLTAGEQEVQKGLGGVNVESLIDSLAQAWPQGVIVRRLHTAGSTVTLTATASSALTAVSALGQDSRWKQVRVIQIRPTAAGEEFDVEGILEP
jgi:hypothetical protein